MKLKLICYSLKGMSPVERMKFQREVYGFKDMSNNGKYVYRRPGIMDSIQHEKIRYSGLVVHEKDVKTIIKLMKKHNAKIHIVDSPSKGL